MEPLHRWIDQQHQQGIGIVLVRQADLAGDPDLLVDLGIYGNRAVGFQELDGKGQTLRFTLSFDFPEILAAEQRWERLLVYAVDYEKLLDRASGSR